MAGKADQDGPAASPAVKLKAPENAPCRGGPMIRLPNPGLWRLLFCPLLARSPLSMVLGSRRAGVGYLITDRLAKPSQPQSRPGEFDAEYRQSDRNNDQRGSRRDDHDETKDKQGCPYQGNCDTARHSVGKTGKFFDHTESSLVGSCYLIGTYVRAGGSLGTQI